MARDKRKEGGKGSSTGTHGLGQTEGNACSYLTRRCATKPDKYTLKNHDMHIQKGHNQFVVKLDAACRCPFACVCVCGCGSRARRSGSGSSTKTGVESWKGADLNLGLVLCPSILAGGIPSVMLRLCRALGLSLWPGTFLCRAQRKDR